MARWHIIVSGAEPCQWRAPGGITTVSPDRIFSAGACAQQKLVIYTSNESTLNEFAAAAFNRETGKPLYPIVEMAVPTKSDVPNEEIYPTQPIPFNARSVPQSPFCATFPSNIEDPKLQAQARVMFTPPSLDP